MTEQVAWLDGRQISLDQMRLPVWDLGVVAGAAVSEMARTYRHQPFRFEDHVGRLMESCRELGFEPDWTGDQLEHAATRLVEQNVKFLPDTEDLGVVWFVTAGANPTYLGQSKVPGPTTGIHTFRLPFDLWKTAASTGTRLQIPLRTAMPAATMPVHRKIRNRLHWWLADREAAEIETGARALLLTSEGHITETSTSAFYAVIDGVIVTPREGVLNSMSRRMVMEAAESCGIPFETADLTTDDLPRMEQAFLSSTPSGLLPVQSINGQSMGDAGMLTPLLDWWRSTTGINPRIQILNVSVNAS